MEAGYHETVCCDLFFIELYMPIFPVITLTINNFCSLSKSLYQSAMKAKQKSIEEQNESHEARMRKHYIDKGIETVIDRLRMERRRRNILPQTLFDLFDVDKNGSLSAEELEDALVRMKMPHTGVEVEGMIFMYDRDKTTP